jgi:RNA polymerase sigma-70 factor, ECF subfamily
MYNQPERLTDAAVSPISTEVGKPTEISDRFSTVAKSTGGSDTFRNRAFLGALEPTVEAPNLLAKIAEGDRIALSKFYDRYARMIYAIAWKSLNSVEDCQEVVLEVFTQIWKIADRFDPDKGSVENWIFTLARSRILDRLRQLQRLAKVNDAIAAAKESEFPTASVDLIEAVEIVERRQQVLTALNQIPPAQRQVIELAYYQGFTHTEIAAHTGLSLGTVKTCLRLGLSKLKVAFETRF